MSSMSTPINQLPPGATSSSSPNDDDPSVTDVIKEMEKEFKIAAPVQHIPAPVHVPTPSPMYVAPLTTPVMKEKSSNKWFHEKSAKRAVIVAVIALVLFYPQDLSAIYNKNPIMSKFASYDRLIRAAFFALVLYILFWKLDI